MEILFEQEINASADEVWELLGSRFAEIGDWAESVEWSKELLSNDVPSGYKVDSSAPVSGRITPNPLGELTEILTMYSDNKKEFTFEGYGLPPIFSKVSNTTRVVSLEKNNSKVFFDVEMSLKGIFRIIEPILKRRFKTSNRGPRAVILDLKRYFESIERNK